MVIKRRTFLRTSAALSLATVFSEIFQTASAQSIDKSKFNALCERWADIITGRKNIDPKDPRYQAALAALDKKAAQIQQELVRTPNREQIFTNIHLQEDKSPAITATPRAALNLAIAWATPGSIHYQNPEILQDAIAALDDFLKLRYHPGQEEYGNWWDWESGASRAVGDMMCILHDQLPPETLIAAADGINFFIPDPIFLRTTKAGGSSQKSAEKILSTGANRLDLCRAVICSAAATQDEERLRHAIAGLGDTWAFVEEGDGFYRDGSFIQHHHIPYTGSYGNVLIDGLSKLFTLVSDSPFNIPVDERKKVYALIDQSFIPVIVDGQVIDFVRGRSVSRMKESGVYHGKSIIRAMLQLAQGAPEELAKRWRATIQGWISRNPNDKFTNSKNLAEIALFADLAKSDEIAPPQNMPTMFPSMDRLVHRSPKGWTAGVAMCSRRIAWYECGNGENNLASRTGSGMRYLMLPDDMGQFEDGFWATLDYTAPPGTTVDQHPLKPKVGGEWGNNTPQNEWTGGLTQKGNSVAAMHLIGIDDNGLEARRLWHGNENMLIEAVSDLKTENSPAFTVIEHRNLGKDGKNALIIDGKEVDEVEVFDNPRWAHLENVAGYIFLTPSKITGKKENREGSWLDINERKYPGAEEKINRHWASLHFEPQDQKAGAWIILPQASRKETEAFAQSPTVNIVQNDEKAQIIEHENATSFVIWQAGNYAGWQFKQPVVAFLQKEGDKLELSLADPTQNTDRVTVVIPGNWSFKGQHVTAENQDDQTTLTFNTKGRAGNKIDCQLTHA